MFKLNRLYNFNFYHLFFFKYYSTGINWVNSKLPGWYNNVRFYPKDKRKWHPLTGEYRNYKLGYIEKDCSINSWPIKSRLTNQDKITGE